MDVTEKEKRLATELKRLLPGIVLSPVRAGNISAVNNAHYSIMPENINLYHSQYFYKKTLHFVHFTSLDTLKSILASKTLRLYNLNNLNDPREYSFAGDLLTYNIDNRQDAKRNMFLFSMCKTSILKGPAEIEFNMWRLYGQFGSGVCLQFDLALNPLENWKQYFLSEIFYGAGSKTSLLGLNKLLVSLENEKPQTSIDLAQIVAFHKSNLYKLEREVRLVFDNRERRTYGPSYYSEYSGERLSPLIYDDGARSTMNGKEIKYLDLPIFNKDFHPVSEHIPVPKLTKVILGFGHRTNFQEAANQLMALAQDNLGYPIRVEQSRLTKYYYER